MAETLSSFIKTQTRTTGQYPAILTERGWSVRDLLHGHEKFLSGLTREILSGQNGFILPARLANHNTGFASPCPLVDSAILYHNIYDLQFTRKRQKPKWVL